MRLFLGLELSAGIRDSIAEYTAKLQKELPALRAKWVPKDSLHVTLKFIGETERSENIQQALRCVHSPPVTLTFRGLGFFTQISPRIFWTGVESGPELAALVDSIEIALRPVGVSQEPHEYQEFQAHLTLARSGYGKQQGIPNERDKMPMVMLRDLLADRPQPEFGTMTAGEFILYRSETLPGGSRYTPLKRFLLR